jgi:hypothetical protein
MSSGDSAGERPNSKSKRVCKKIKKRCLTFSFLPTIMYIEVGYQY